MGPLLGENRKMSEGYPVVRVLDIMEEEKLAIIWKRRAFELNTKIPISFLIFCCVLGRIQMGILCPW